MTREGDIGAVVVGGGLGGLSAAAYLARSGVRVVLIEAESRVGGGTGTVEIAEDVNVALGEDVCFALDPQMIRDLDLARRGLRYAERDMMLTSLRAGGRHLFLPRNTLAARVSLAEQAPQDFAAYKQFRQETLHLARCLRPLWTGAVETNSSGEPIEAVIEALDLSAADAAKFHSVVRSSAAAYLDRWFESEALKTALCFDTVHAGLSPQEPGSALALLWRYAQESSGLQAATAQIAGGPSSLVRALAATARKEGAGLHMNASVKSLLVSHGAAAGVTLANGIEVRAPIVLSSLSRRQTLFGLLPATALPLDEPLPFAPTGNFASGKVAFYLASRPPFVGLDRNALRGRLIVVERPESIAEAKGAAMRGEIAQNLVLEVTVPSIADPSLAPIAQHVLSARVHFLAQDIDWAREGDGLVKRVLNMLESYAPGLKDRVIAQKFIPPNEASSAAFAEASASPVALLKSYGARVRTPVRGLYLCGKGAEPVVADSARSGRIAAAAALAGRVRRIGR